MSYIGRELNNNLVKAGKTNHLWNVTITAQKIKFFITDFFSKCDQICSFLRIWSHLLKKSVMEKFIFCLVYCDILQKSVESPKTSVRKGF